MIPVASQECEASNLQPIRVGHVAVQPQASLSAITFVGLDAFVPEELRPLCSCAGLFFARVESYRAGESYTLAIAALPHYLHADHATQSRHVRSITLSQFQFEYLLEYTRSRQSLPTWEQLEAVKIHARGVSSLNARSRVAVPSSSEEEKHQDVPGEHTSPTAHGEPQRPQRRREVVSLKEGPMVTVSQHTIEHIWNEVEKIWLNKKQASSRHKRPNEKVLPFKHLYNETLLRAALEQASKPQERAEICRALSWSDRRLPDQVIVPVYEGGTPFATHWEIYTSVPDKWAASNVFSFTQAAAA